MNVDDLLVINDTIKKYYNMRRKDDEWELYSVFIPDGCTMEAVVEYINTPEQEKQTKYKKWNPYKDLHADGYKYIVMHNKHDKEMVVLWVRFEND